MTQNVILTQASIAERIAHQSVAARRAGYADEVQRLLDAGLAMMRTCGTESRPRVSDIVAAAGLSNDAFYRYFPSKDALVRAILDAGTQRLHGYLHHQMAKQSSPEEQVHAWVTGVLSQAADADTAASTLAVLWNAGSLGEATGVPFGFSETLGTLLQQPLEALGSRDPVLDATLAAHAVVGRLANYLWRKEVPAADEVERIVQFCLPSDRVAATRRRRMAR